MGDQPIAQSRRNSLQDDNILIKMRVLCPRIRTYSVISSMIPASIYWLRADLDLGSFVAVKLVHGITRFILQTVGMGGVIISLGDKGSSENRRLCLALYGGDHKKP
jgi:hypothetical protein